MKTKYDNMYFQITAEVNINRRIYGLYRNKTHNIMGSVYLNSSGFCFHPVDSVGFSKEELLDIVDFIKQADKEYEKLRKRK